MIKYYTLARLCSQTYGHGDSADEYHICPIDAYHDPNSKEFHPLFVTPELAGDYMSTLPFPGYFTIVELKVADNS